MKHALLVCTLMTAIGMSLFADDAANTDDLTKSLVALATSRAKAEASLIKLKKPLDERKNGWNTTWKEAEKRMKAGLSRLDAAIKAERVKEEKDEAKIKMLQQEHKNIERAWSDAESSKRELENQYRELKNSVRSLHGVFDNLTRMEGGYKDAKLPFQGLSSLYDAVSFRADEVVQAAKDLLLNLKAEIKNVDAAVAMGDKLVAK